MNPKEVLFKNEKDLLGSDQVDIMWQMSEELRTPKVSILSNLVDSGTTLKKVKVLTQ